MKRLNTEVVKQELALALLLLKDFKSDGKFDVDIAIEIFDLADYLDCKKELESLMSKLPPMKISPRD